MPCRFQSVLSVVISRVSRCFFPLSGISRTVRVVAVTGQLPFALVYTPGLCSDRFSASIFSGADCRRRSSLPSADADRSIETAHPFANWYQGVPGLCLYRSDKMATLSFVSLSVAAADLRGRGGVMFSGGE